MEKTAGSAIGQGATVPDVIAVARAGAGVDRWRMSGLSDAGLLSGLDAALARRRAADAEIARYAGEVVERSRSELGAGGLARRSGNSSASQLVASIGRLGRADAARYCRVGAATTARFSIAGEQLPPAFAALAAAVDTGVVTVDAASHIVTQLSLARPRADVDDLLAAETALVDYAAVATADDVKQLAVQWREHLDTDGIEPREAELIAARSLKRFWLSNGLRRFQLDLDPEHAAYVDTVIDAETATAFRTVRFSGHDDATPQDSSNVGVGGSVIEDTRTAAQIGADVFTDIARHVLGCDNTTPTLSTTTVVVRMTLDQLTTGLGSAAIGADEQPISAGTARRLAADADIIPAVLRGNSEILDWGRSKRLFSKAQRAAMVERDGGCICGCRNPAVYLEAHHTKWWERDAGHTDLDQGLLVCTRAHTMIHTHKWEIRFIDRVPYLIPPPTIDPKQTPRRHARPPAPTRA